MDELGLAIMFHEHYERLAPAFGYATRDETRIFNADSKNGQLMVEVCRHILAHFNYQNAALATEVERLRETLKITRAGLKFLESQGHGNEHTYQQIKMADAVLAAMKGGGE